MADTVEASTPTNDPATVSLADHAAQFSPTREERPADAAVSTAPTPSEPAPTAETPVVADRPRDESGRFTQDKPRHRAQSQKATAADVPRINELTRKLREAEAELAKFRTPQVEPQTYQPPQASTQPAQPAKPASSVREAIANPDISRDPLAFDVFLETYPDADYSDYTRYMSRYEVVWDRAQSAQQQQQRAMQDSAGRVDAVQREREAEWNQRVQAFAQTRPDFGEKMQAFGPYLHTELPPVLTEAILAEGPETLYHLASNPELLFELHLLADGKPVTEHHVAGLRRRLSTELSRQQAATTGSAATFVPAKLAPRPPNPVRTGPMRSGDDPPGDGHSLAAHRQHYDPKRRR